MFHIIPAATADRTNAARVLAEAFSADRHVLGLLPPGKSAGKLFRVFSQSFDETMASGGHVYLAISARDRTPLGVAMWEAPGSSPSLRAFILGIPTYLGVFGSHTPGALRTLRAESAHRPRAPHWYLTHIGTTEAARGMGVGSALINDRLRQADRQRLGTYLESSILENVPFYERFGFVVRGEVPTASTPLVGMWRPPQN